VSAKTGVVICTLPCFAALGIACLRAEVSSEGDSQTHWSKSAHPPALLVDAQRVQLCRKVAILTEVLNHVHEPNSSICP